MQFSSVLLLRTECVNQLENSAIKIRLDYSKMQTKKAIKTFYTTLDYCDQMWNSHTQ